MLIDDLAARRCGSAPRLEPLELSGHLLEHLPVGPSQSEEGAVGVAVLAGVQMAVAAVMPVSVWPVASRSAPRSDGPSYPTLLPNFGRSQPSLP